MTDEQIKELENILKDRLQEQFMSGIRVGWIGAYRGIVTKLSQNTNEIDCQSVIRSLQKEVNDRMKIWGLKEIDWNEDIYAGLSDEENAELDNIN